MQYTLFWETMPEPQKSRVQEFMSSGNVVVPTGSRIYAPDAVTADSDWDLVFLKGATTLPPETKTTSDGSSSWTLRDGPVNYILCSVREFKSWVNATKLMFHVPRGAIFNKNDRVAMFRKLMRAPIVAGWSRRR